MGLCRFTNGILIFTTILTFLLSIYSLFIFNKQSDQPSLRSQEHRQTNQKLTSYQEIGLFNQHKISHRNLSLNHKVVFYNRVPKCGSTSMITIFNKLKQPPYNHKYFYFNDIEPRQPHFLDSEDLKLEFVKNRLASSLNFRQADNLFTDVMKNNHEVG